ncbi:MAG: GAF domain-containing protein [Anaerolineales bacterium]
MPEGQPFVYGIGLLIFGLVFVLGVWFVLRIVPRVRPAQLQPVQPSLIQIQEHLDAFLIVQSGGRITYVNEIARTLFDLPENEYPSLDRIGRRVRPGEIFLEVCAAQGQARFSINGQLVDAVSYPLPGPIPSILVTIRQAKSPLAVASQDGLSETALKTVADFGQAVTSTLSLEATVHSILTHVEQLVAADFLEIKIWDEGLNRFIAYKMSGVGGAAREVLAGQETQFGDYARHVFSKKQELVFENTRIENSVRFDANGPTVPPMGSYIGIPLEAGGQLIGVLEVGIIPADSFSNDDVSLLRMVSGQAAVAIRNALLYENQERWTSQLLGLTNLSQTAGSLHNMRDLFSNLVDGLSPLFGVNMLGFLLYDEYRRSLEAQSPFFGLSSQFVDIYKTIIRPGSEAEKILSMQEILSTADASSDAIWAELGLQDMAQAASMRDTTLVPLVSTGRFLGFLQLSNNQKGYASLNPDELQLLNLVASQVASTVDNALLVQQARQRNQRSESLRRLASLVSSSATLDETLRFAIQEASQLLNADVAAVFLLDERDGIMRAHIDSVYGLESEGISPLSKFHVRPAVFHQTVAGSQRAFLSGNLSKDRRVLSFYRVFVRRLKIESCIVIPLVVRGQGIGELMIGAKSVDAFSNYDLQVATIIGSQLTVAIENNRSADKSLSGSKDGDEQAAHISRISREFNTTTDLRELLRLVYDESLKVTRANHAAVMFFEKEDAPEARYPDSVLMSLGKARMSETLWAQSSVSLPDELLVIDSFEDTAPSPSPDVHCVVFAPIYYREQLFGLIELHFRKNNSPDEVVMDTLQVLTAQAAVAISNTFRHREQHQRINALTARTKALDTVLDVAHSIGKGLGLTDALNTAAQAIQRTTPFDVVLISLYDRETEMLKRACAVGVSEETFADLQAHQQPWSSLEQLLKPEFEHGNLYFIPHDRVPVVPSTVQLVTLMDAASEQPNAWHPEDLLLVPVLDSENNPLGLISVDSPRDGRRPSEATLETLEIFAVQLQVALNNARRFSGLEGEIQSLSREVQRQKSLVGFSQRNLPMLLNKDLDQTISINYLSQRALHIRAGLNLTEAISRQLDFNSALLTLGQQILFSFDMSISLVAKDGPEGPQILYMFGSLPRGVNPDAMFGQRNPLRYCIQTGETLVSANLDEDETWHDTPFLTALKAKSFICLPLVADEKNTAAILAIGFEPMPALLSDDQQVYVQIARQLSVTIQNIGLFSETRHRLAEVNLLLDFSRRLGGLNPEEILNALLESALRVVSNAHAGVVLVWDEVGELLVPKSAANYVDTDSTLELTYRLGEGLPGRIFASRQPQIIDEVNFTSDYNLSAESLLLYRKATGGRLPVSSIAVPIQVNERGVGILVLDNFNTSAAFRQEDEAILSSLTQQVALSLENVRLVQATQERATQLQALNSVAAALSSSLDRDELIDSLLERINTIIAYDTAILWMRNENRMVVAQARGFDDAEDRKGLTVSVEDSILLKQMIESGKEIWVGDVRSDARFPSLVEAKNLSWLGIPIMVKGNVIGVIVLEKAETHYYSNEQIQLASTFASQAAVALENANLFEESLRRTSELDERSKRLSLLNQFSSDLSGSLNADQVLRLTANQLMLAIGAETAMVIMLDRNDKSFLMAVLPEEQEQASMYRALPDSDAISELRELQTVYVADNIASHPELQSLAEFIGQASSLLILPVFSTESNYAVMVLSEQPHLFSPTEIEIARTLGNQAVIALENADLYQSTVATAERLSILNQVSFEIGSSLKPETVYLAIHDAVAKLMPIDAFVIALHDEQTNEVDGVYIVDMGQRINGVRLPFGQGLSGKVIATGEPILTLTSEDADSQGAVTVGEKGTPNSILAVPMIQGEKIMGMISTQSYQHNAYTQNDMELLSTLANQVTVAIQNGRLFDQTQKMAATLEQRVIERTAELEREQRNTETLLRILTEVSASLDLDRALSRTLALLNDAIGAEQGTVMLVNPEDNMLHYRAGYGYVSETSEQVDLKKQQSTFSLKIGEGLAGWVVKNRQSVLVEDLYTDPRWVVSQSSQNHRSAVVAPLTVGEDVIGAIMVYHRRQAFFSEDSLEMVKAIGAQVAIAINNAQLYELIRDQAERLGGYLRTQQMEASRQTAILEAVADGVLVTDSVNKISFVNPSAEKILDIASSQIEGRSLENFAGLFGKSSQAWMQTVREWSENSASHTGETYAEQISLDNGHVVLVHLAPVLWQNEFLGTVSIFRDITHEVEVDRLKSEFVATVSHELRTPMTSIRGYVDILLMGAAGDLSDSQLHFLDIVKNNTERLNILVNDLLDISRIETGRVALNLQPMDLREVADEVVSEVLRRSQEENKPMAIVVDAQPDLPLVLVDPDRIHQIVGNLVDNAYNYTPHNGKITINIHSVGENVQVDVQDTGVGIPLEDQSHIFERFFRGEDPLVLATPGTGLGLSIVAQLVEMHNGKIWMESSGLPGDGSTFSFTVPAEENEE